MWKLGHRRASIPSMLESHGDAEAAMVGKIASGGNTTGLDFDPTQDRSFHTAAARVIMKLMYVERRSRPGLLRTIFFPRQISH